MVEARNYWSKSCSQTMKIKTTRHSKTNTILPHHSESEKKNRFTSHNGFYFRLSRKCAYVNIGRTRIAEQRRICSPYEKYCYESASE